MRFLPFRSQLHAAVTAQGVKILRPGSPSSNSNESLRGIVCVYLCNDLADLIFIATYYFLMCKCTLFYLFLRPWMPQWTIKILFNSIYILQEARISSYINSWCTWSTWIGLKFCKTNVTIYIYFRNSREKHFISPMTCRWHHQSTGFLPNNHKNNVERIKQTLELLNQL